MPQSKQSPTPRVDGNGSPLSGETVSEDEMPGGAMPADAAVPEDDAVPASRAEDDGEPATDVADDPGGPAATSGAPTGEEIVPPEAANDAVAPAPGPSPVRGPWRRRGEPRTAPLVSGDDLDRIVADLHRLGSRFSQPSPQQARLATRISIAARELSTLARDRKTRSEPWARAATALIGEARDALDARQVVDGWELLRAAERHLIEGRSAEDLEDQLALTRQRLTELAPEAATALPAPQTANLKVLRSTVRRVRGLLDAYLDELDRIIEQRARMLGRIAVLLVAVLIATGLAVASGLPSADAGEVLTRFGGFMTAVGLGLAGAVISRALHGERNAGARIVEATNPILVILFRLGIGGVGALAVTVVLQSDLQTLFSASGAAAYPVALAAGFAERLADRVYARTEEGCAELAAGSLGVEDI